MTTLEPSPPSLSLFRLFLKFLRFGFLAFGGPVAQIAVSYTHLTLPTTERV